MSPAQAGDTSSILAQEGPACCGAIRPVHHNSRACAPERRSHEHGSQRARQAMLHKQRRSSNEKPADCNWSVGPTRRSQRDTCTTKTQDSQTNDQFYKHACFKKACLGATHSHLLKWVTLYGIWDMPISWGLSPSGVAHTQSMKCVSIDRINKAAFPLSSWSTVPLPAHLYLS